MAFSSVDILGVLKKCATLDDISTETGMRKQTLSARLDAMVGEGLVAEVAHHSACSTCVFGCGSSSCRSGNSTYMITCKGYAVLEGGSHTK
jgi:hypothetical protein